MRSRPIPQIRKNSTFTVAFPYPSGAMHVGHGRTYIVPDVIARFWRMRGRQVLFPMAFHVTGAPVVGISKRIARKDEKTIRLYRDLYKVPQNVLEGFTDPLTIVKHFAAEYQRVMTSCGPSRLTGAGALSRSTRPTASSSSGSGSTCTRQAT